MDEKGGRWRKVWVRLFQVLLTVVLLVAVTEGVLFLLVSRKEKQIETRWAKYGQGSLQESFAGLPRNKTNETAHAVEEAAAAMGLVLKTESGGASTGPSLPPAVSEYGSAQAESPSSAVDPPPAEVASALSERAESLEDLRRTLAAGPAPLWESDPDKLFAAPIPPLLPNVSLNRLLMADAFSALAAGDPGRAMADAEAGWALVEPLFARPELISKYVGMAGARMWLVVLRKSPSVPEVWPARLAALDMRKEMVQSLRYEALNGFFMARRGGLELGTSEVLQGGFLDRLSQPLLKFWLLDAVARNLDLVEAMERQAPCSGPYDALMKAHEESIPSWSVIARIATPNLGDGWARAERSRLDVELTQKVLALKSARGADGGRSASPEGFERSYCPKARWVASVQDGTLAISLEGGPEFPQNAPWAKYPLRYEEPSPAPLARR